MRTRVACCSLLCQKLFQVSSADYVRMSTGKAVNLLSNDVFRFDYLFLSAPSLITAPIQVLIVAAFCWYTIGWYCMPGIALLIMFAGLFMITPVPFKRLRKKTALLTDRRLLHMNELLNAIKVVKASCWEDMFMKVVARVRRQEIRFVLFARLLECMPPSLSTCSIKLSMFLIILSFLLSKGQMPTSSQVYQVQTAISPTRISILILLPMAFRMGAESWISARRIEEILQLGDKFSLDIHSHEDTGQSDLSTDQQAECSIVISEATFSRQKILDVFPALEDINVSIKRGHLVAIIGPVASGKSSLIDAILGELFRQKGKVQVNGVISYSAQDPWIFNGTIRQNVLFGSKLSQDRLNKVYQVTCLDKDLQITSGGDQHFLGDKGAGLSGGQKARLSLARAIYRQADIYLLDEPLGAVDVKTAEKIFTSCISGFLRGKTVLMATHLIQFLPRCDWIIIIDKGRVELQGTYETLKAEGVDLWRYVKEEDISVEPDAAIKSSHLVGAKTVERTLSKSLQAPTVLESGNTRPQETMARGDVGFKLYAQYMHAGAGIWPVAILIACLLCGTVVLFILTDWWLARWLTASDNGTTSDESEHGNSYFLAGFIGLTVASLASAILRCVIFILCAVNASRVLHNRMFHKILKAPLYFFTVTPIGIILNRFSKDVGAMDDIIPATMQEALDYGLTVIGLLVYIAIVNPYTLLVIFPYIFVALFLRRVYLKCAQDVKRLDAVTRTPIFAHLGNTLLGLPTIRAFGMQQQLIEEFHEHLDHNTKAFNLFLTTQRWFQLRLEIISSMFVLFAAFAFVAAGKSLTASSTGLSLSYAVTMLGLFQWAVRRSAETANHMTSVERVMEYSKLKGESESTVPDEVPDGWMSSATVQLKDVSFQYGPDTEEVLKDVSFSVQRGEKVGVVGRTGAGKSSIFNAILRMGTTTGTVLLDGIDIKMISLRKLRSHVSLIPQEPMLFTSTIRENLDPFEEHTDEEIWEALRKVEMKEEIQRSPLGLQTLVTEGGGSLSVGQRQLLCMARALLQMCSLILVDEATANVDRTTDALIQKMIRQNFAKCTVITIAHRLDTIIDSDVVLVFDKGRLVEEGIPTSLLSDSSSRFYSLAAEQGSAELSRLTNLAKLALDEGIAEKR